MFSFLGSLPIWAKIGLALITIVVVVLTAFYIAALVYTRTEEKLAVSLTCGSNRLEIKQVVSRFVGGTSTGHRLYWNGRAVSRRGGIEGPGDPDAVPPADPADQKRVIIKRFTDQADPTAWTVWMNPDDFSRADFDALSTCLTTQQTEITRQLNQSAEPAETSSYESALLSVNASFRIGQLVYGSNQAIERRVYRWEPGSDKELHYELSVEPDGRVDLQNRLVSVTIGKVDFADGQRVLSWRYADDIAILGSDLLNFKTKQGELLTARYQLRHATDDAQLFFRKTAGYAEQILIYPADTLQPKGNVSGRTIDLAHPLLRRVYGAGYVTPDSTDKSLPIFYWRDWPDHPLTKADLQQFRNEQGQGLGEIVQFRKLKLQQP